MVFARLLLAAAATAAAAPRRNVFGIGVYGDTPGAPPVADQLEDAAALAGERGWVTLYLCAWKNATHACMNESTTGVEAADVEALEAAYAAPSGTRRDEARLG